MRSFVTKNNSCRFFVFFVLTVNLQEICQFLSNIDFDSFMLVDEKNKKKVKQKESVHICGAKSKTDK